MSIKKRSAFFGKMEGFPRDVQTIILRKIAGTDEPGRLYDLSRVNHTFRHWVTRFVWDYCVPVERIYRHIKYTLGDDDLGNPDFVRWDVINRLKAQWEKQPSLFVSFCMYASIINGLTLVQGPPIHRVLYTRSKPAKALFWKRKSFLASLKTLITKIKARDVCLREIDKYQGLVDKHRRAMERYEERLEKNLSKRDPLEREVEELEDALIIKKAKVKKNK
jgi:hypothetical protein